MTANLRTTCTLKMPRIDSCFDVCAVSRFGLCLFFDLASLQIELYDAKGHNLKSVAMRCADWSVAHGARSAVFVSRLLTTQTRDELGIVFVGLRSSDNWNMGDVQRVTIRRAVKVHLGASVSRNVACVTDSRANEPCEQLFTYDDVRVTDDQFAVTELSSLIEHVGHFYFVDQVNNCLKSITRT